MRAGDAEAHPENLRPPDRGPTAALCAPRDANTQCPPVDDYDAILSGTRGVTTRDGGAPVRSCPNVDGTVSDEPPWRKDPPCSTNRNKQLVIKHGSVATHVLFYDDPACRQAGPGSNLTLSQAPYYRVWEVAGVGWTGEGW